MQKSKPFDARLWLGCWDCSELTGPFQNKPQMATLPMQEGRRYVCHHCGRLFEVKVIPIAKATE